jgi:xanthine dehydrogenase YagR molybdenum-binding subunit
LAEQLGLDPANVRFLLPQAGGAFGVSGGLSQRTVLVALAARMIGRPVPLEATRSQGFTITSFRSETRQRVRLAAGRDGRLQAMIHDGLALTSRADVFATAAVAIATTMRLYARPNVAGSAGVVAADRGTPVSPSTSAVHSSTIGCRPRSAPTLPRFACIVSRARSASRASSARTPPAASSTR